MLEFFMPRVSLSDDEEMVVARWLVEVGTEFREGEPLLEVETAKAAMQVEAPSDGVLVQILIDADQPIRQGEVLAYLGAVVEELMPTGVDVRPLSATTPAAGDSTVVNSVASSAPAVATSARAGQPSRVDITRTVFAGPGELYGVPTYRGARRSALVRVGATESAPGGEAVAAPMTKHRAALARLMTQSAAIPQFSVRKLVAMDAAVDTVRRLRDGGLQSTLTDVLLRAVGLALLRHPEMNAHFIAEEILYFPEPAVSLATDSPNGVIAPVIRNPQLMSWQDLEQNRRRIVAGARAGRLLPADLNGGTFSMSNVGAIGGDGVVPLLIPPQVGILGVGAIRATGGASMVTLDLVADHRALDGADVARFLVTLADLLAPDSAATSLDPGTS